MGVAEFTPWQWLGLVQHELLLFAGVFFLLGALDELAVDVAWLWLRVTGKARDRQLPVPTACFGESLSGGAAVFIPAWHEEAVIGATVSHALKVWPYRNLRLYVGCYRNDPVTMAAVVAAAQGDGRLRLVIHDADGPTTKADCLNRLYHALQQDEQRSGWQAHMVVLHDAEDMVDPDGLALLDQALRDADLAQLPVLPQPQPDSRWIGSHYCEEFAEAHGKAMVVRNALGAGMPLAGVGCGIARMRLDKIALSKADGRPFAADCLTEDYELGLGVAEQGGSARFLRFRRGDGSLVATRAYFPGRLDQAVRQKTRWIHGIAFQGWDRMGWQRHPADIWMRLRDRRGPLSAFVLAVAYALLFLSAIAWGLSLAGLGAPIAISDTLRLVLLLDFASFAWRICWRYGFTAREYGWGEGLRAIVRIPVANIIAIMAGRRALMGYLRSLLGNQPRWDKTDHAAHPSIAVPLAAST